MMLRPATHLSLSVVFLLISTAPAGPSAINTSANRRAAPAPAASVQRVALRKVDEWLKNSTGNVEQPEALAPFFDRLYHARAAGTSGDGAVHILHFGDSHTAADWWTADLRDLFQHRFGNGGSGFSVAGRPFKGYRRVDAPSGASLLWQSEGLHAAE